MVNGIKRRSFLTSMTALGAAQILSPRSAGAAVGSARPAKDPHLKINPLGFGHSPQTLLCQKAKSDGVGRFGENQKKGIAGGRDLLGFREIGEQSANCIVMPPNEARCG